MKNNLEVKRLHIDISASVEDMLFSPIEVTPDMVVFSPPRETAHLKRYEELKREFLKEGVTYKRQCLIKGLAREWQVQMKCTLEESFKLIIEIASGLMLNEIEIVF